MDDGTSFSTNKKKSYQVKIYRGNLNAYFYMKEASVERLVFYDSNSVTLQKRQNHGDSEELRVASSEQGGGMR